MPPRRRGKLREQGTTKNEKRTENYYVSGFSSVNGQVSPVALLGGLAPHPSPALTRQFIFRKLEDTTISSRFFPSFLLSFFPSRLLDLDSVNHTPSASQPTAYHHGPVSCLARRSHGRLEHDKEHLLQNNRGLYVTVLSGLNSPSA